MSNIFSTTQGSDEELEIALSDEIARRKQLETAGSAGTALGGIGAGVLKSSIHQTAYRDLINEFDEIRNDPELKKKQTDQMIRTYEKYLAQGNNPVEIFIPIKDRWAAGQTAEGDDVVWYDPSAPHPAVMAHELGHVQMNHSSDPLSWLQRSGVGRVSQAAAPVLGAGGALLGRGFGGRNNRNLGAAVGGLTGTVASSGNFAYELGGATGRGMGYLPDDVDKQDAYGDLLRAGSTYGMAGPGTAAATAITAGGTAAFLATDRGRRMAGQVLQRFA